MTDPNAIESRIARMEESDFRFALERRRVSDEIRNLQQDGDTEVEEQNRKAHTAKEGALCDAWWYWEVLLNGDTSFDRIREGRSPS